MIPSRFLCVVRRRWCLARPPPNDLPSVLQLLLFPPQSWEFRWEAEIRELKLLQEGRVLQIHTNTPCPHAHASTHASLSPGREQDLAAFWAFLGKPKKRGQDHQPTSNKDLQSLSLEFYFSVIKVDRLAGSLRRERKLGALSLLRLPPILQDGSVFRLTEF